MIKQTQQQRDNTLYALKRWQKVPPEKVFPRLARFRSRSPSGCGTVACFGGHVMTWPFFKKQGVYADKNYPAMHLPGGSEGLSDMSVSLVLFSSSEMFCARGVCQVDREDGAESDTDHECVTRRLQWLIDNSEVV